jgi:DNA-binding NarL/FixJ family response regulator
MRHRPKILIADDHTLVAEACGRLLIPEFDVVGVVSDGRTLLQLAPKIRPDLVIVDIAMPHITGLDAAEQLKQTDRAIKLIFLAATAEPDVVAEAFRRGASGYVAKHCAAEELIVAVRRVLKGESFVSSHINKDDVDFRLRSRPMRSKAKRLTDREYEVLRLLAEGKTGNQISDLLHVTPNTVFFHKYRIMEVLNLRTSAELIQYAIRHRLK